LPTKHIRIRIPISSSIISVSDYSFTDRGIIADFEVETKIEDMLQGIDKELGFAIDLIRQDNIKN